MRPSSTPIIDTLVSIPMPPDAPKYEALQGALGQNAGDPTTSPVKHLFKDIPKLPDGADPIGHTLSEMDRFGIERGVVDVTLDAMGEKAVLNHPDRFIASITLNPNDGMGAVRQLVDTYERLGVRAACLGPALISPEVPIDDRRAYPIYAKCAELDIPVFITVGMPGPRVRFAPQKVELLDEICWFFPDLKVVMRHGAAPWVDLAVMLMRKYPNLHFSTSAFAPRRYPQEIVHYANGHGADQFVYAGYYAVGLTWERILRELDELPLNDGAWDKFLNGNARRLLRLDES